MSKIRKFNESEGYELLSQKAIEELSYYYGVDSKNKLDKIKVFKDPKVSGTLALRVYRSSDEFEFDLLWTRDGFEEVEFDTFPPISGDLNFF